jgi:hypothetical protein
MPSDTTLGGKSAHTFITKNLKSLSDKVVLILEQLKIVLSNIKSVKYFTLSASIV